MCSSAAIECGTVQSVLKVFTCSVLCGLVLAVAAAADQNEDYPGSCGRCYRVRCKSGVILGESVEACTETGGNCWDSGPCITAYSIVPVRKVYTADKLQGMVH